MTTPVRQTRQRATVRSKLAEVAEFISAQQLHARISAAGDSVGLATVYRCLQSMEAVGEVDSIMGADGEVRYRLCSGEHHHHLVCRECGKTVELQTQVVEEWVSSMARSHGFIEVDHSFELMGICTDCVEA